MINDLTATPWHHGENPIHNISWKQYKRFHKEAGLTNECLLTVMNDKKESMATKITASQCDWLTLY